MTRVCGLGISLLIKGLNLTDRGTLMELEDGGDREDLIDVKVGGVHNTDSRLRPSQICLENVIWALASSLSLKTDRCTHMEQGLAER